MQKTINTIRSLMLKEHERIKSFLEKIEKDIDDYEKTKANFNKFKWNMEKHFFVEEKVIFNMFVDISGKETTDTFHLLSDHVKLMNMMRDLEDKLEDRIKPNIEPLKNALLTHKDFEDKSFYPLLDERLSPEQKKQIAERINEIIPG